MTRMAPFGIPRPPPPASLLASHVSDLLGPGRYDVDRSARALETHGRLPSNRGTTGFVAPWATRPPRRTDADRRAGTPLQPGSAPSPHNSGAPTGTTTSSSSSSATAPATTLPPAAPPESPQGVPDPGPGAYDVYKASAALEYHGRGPSTLGSPGMVRDTNGAPNPGLLDRSSQTTPGPGVYNVGTASRATEVRIGFGVSTRGTAGFVAPSARRRRPRSAITTTITGRRDAGGAARPHSALVRGGTEGTNGVDGSTTGTAGEVGGTAGEAPMRRTLEGTPEDNSSGNGRHVAAMHTDVEADLLPEPGPGTYDVGRAKQATERRQGASNKGSAGFVPGSSRVRPIVYSNTAGGTAPYGMCAPTCPEGDVGGASSSLGEAVWRAGSGTPSAAFGPSSTGRFNYQEREEEIEERGGGGHRGHRGHRGHAGQGGEGGRVRGRSEGSALVPRRPESPRRHPSKSFHIVVGRVGTPESRREAARFNSRLYGGVQDAQFALGGATVRDLGSSSSSSSGVGTVRSGARSTDHHQHRQQEGMHDASSPPRPETHAIEDRGVLVSRAVSLLRTLVDDNHNVGVPQTMMTPVPTDAHAHGDMMMMMALPASSVNRENEENGQSGENGESGEWRGSDDERDGGGSSDGGNGEGARILSEQSWQRRLDRHFQKTGPLLIAQDALSWHKGGGARVARVARATHAARSSSRRRRRGPAAVSQSKQGRFLRAKAAGWGGTHGGGSGGSGGDGGHSPAAPQGWDLGPRTAQHQEARGGGGGRALDTWSNKARAATAGNWGVGSGRVKATGDNDGGGQENLFALDRSRPSTPRFPPNHFARPATHIYRTSTSVW